MSLLGVVFSCIFVVMLVRVEDTMERISLHRWLDAEAKRYAETWRVEGEARAVAPSPLEFDTWRDDGTRPAWLDAYTRPGFHEYQLGGEDKHFLVTDHPSGSGLLYIVFKDDADDYLDDYEDQLHGWALLLGSAVVAALALASWLLTRRLSTPLKNVVDKVRHLPPDGEPITVDAPYVELRVVEQALANAQRNVSLHVRREQEFSRFASHEMRTPLTVLRGSAETLAKIVEDRPIGLRAVRRIDDACRRTALLIETFLLLGRDGSIVERHGHRDVAELLEEAQRTARETRRHRTLPTIETMVKGSTSVSAPEVLLRVLLDNLVGNALDHATGPIRIRLEDEALHVSNPAGPDERSADGHGYGLIIARRICERMDWALSVKPSPGRFDVVVRFMSGRAAERESPFSAVAPTAPS